MWLRMSKMNFGESSKCETAHKCQKGGVWCGKSAIVEVNVLQSLASLDIRRHLLWRLKQTVLCGYVNYSFVHFTNIFYVCACFSPYFQFWELYGAVQICLLLLLFFCQHCLLLCLHDCTHSFTTTKLFTGFIKALVVLCLQQRISLLNSMVADSQSKRK